LVVCALLPAAGAAGAKPPGIDRSYGHQGIVLLGRNLPAGLYAEQNAGLGSAVGTPSGAVLYAFPVNTCANWWEAGCTEETAVARYSPGGRLDRGFGRHGFLTFTGLGTPARWLAADGRGRLLIASGSVRKDHGVTLARYGAGGHLDKGFGNGGRAFVAAPGGELAAVAVAPRGQIIVAFQGSAYSTGAATESSKVILTRLSSGGHVEAGFGHGGRLSTATRRSCRPGAAVPMSSATPAVGRRTSRRSTGSRRRAGWTPPSTPRSAAPR
jgi:hypothetical protein